MDSSSYHKDMQALQSKVGKDFDCIVAIKRSGWMLGSFLSNQLDKPVFTVSEIDSIPKNYKRCLIVDDKICTGKSINRVARKLTKRGMFCKTACMYVEKNVIPDYFVIKLGKITRMWYEKK